MKTAHDTVVDIMTSGPINVVVSFDLLQALLFEHSSLRLAVVALAEFMNLPCDDAMESLREIRKHVAND